VFDTLFVVDGRAGEPPAALIPLIGFQGRVVGVAGWRLHTEVLGAPYFDRLLAARVFGDPRVYRAARMAKTLSLAVLDPDGRVVFRSRPAAGHHLYAEAPIGRILPGWRISVGPAAGSPVLWAQRFVSAAYLILVILVALCFLAIAVWVRKAGEELRLAEAKSAFLATVSHELKP
jgi:hypothetical protein